MSLIFYIFFFVLIVETGVQYSLPVLLPLFKAFQLVDKEPISDEF